MVQGFRWWRLWQSICACDSECPVGRLCIGPQWLRWHEGVGTSRRDRNSWRRNWPGLWWLWFENMVPGPRWRWLRQFISAPDRQCPATGLCIRSYGLRWHESFHQSRSTRNSRRWNRSGLWRLRFNNMVPGFRRWWLWKSGSASNCQHSAARLRGQ